MVVENIEKIHVAQDKTPRSLIGREAVVQRAALAVNSGKHVFVHGEFGIGKSTFARATAMAAGGSYGVLSFERPVAQSLSKLILDAKRQSLLVGSKSIIHPLISLDRERLIDSQGHLLFLKDTHHLKNLIVDNIFASSPAKLKFLRLLVDAGFTLILILESDKNPEDIFRMRSICQPHIQLTLKRLTLKDSVRVFRRWNSELQLSISTEQIRHLAQQEMGYPLFMRERLNRIRSTSEV